VIDWDVWGPPLAVLVVSMVAGGIVVFRMQSNESTKGTHEEDLLARKKQIMEAIRELDADASKMEEGNYRAQREKLLTQASQVLKALELDEEPDRKPSKSLSSGSLWGYIVGSLAFFAVLGYLLQEYASPRQEGQVMTGGQMDQSAAAQVQIARKERLEEAEKKLAENAKDLDALHVLTYDALLYQDMDKAMQYMETTRSVNPSDPTFIVHLSILQMTVGMYERAGIGFTQALAQNPKNTKALLWQAFMYARMKQPKEALANLKKVDGKLTLQEEIYFAGMLLQDLEKPPAILSGVVEAEGAPEKGMLFVIVRRGETAKGPPVAVKRVPNPQFPIAFELGKGDMVMGGAWPEEVWLEARLDMDGNAMTKSDSDWNSEKLGPIKGSGQGLSVTLTGELTEEPATLDQSANAMVSGIVTGSGAPKGTLFIIARRSQTAKGPPVAVQKVVNPTFPLSFSLSEKNMMMGGTWPEEVWLEARLDMDGNAMTKSKDDWKSTMVGPSAQGSGNISLQLKAQ
jgi:tetratricopeptide (TPR) repeat protein